MGTELGEPLDIKGVAKLVGCSCWVVRQRLIPMGMPVFRSATSGKLIFYRDQVIAWIVRRQQQQTKGGVSV